ncbi:deoxynucleoside kinase [Mycoplasmopsis synoviae]|uniref:deoxynucleoside kinase n=1 Tax=Mycoplasmopsis synoviae TaxID=2109 RepID=UPI000CA1B5BA|nr:deoxynucleoside kinase [Mycoplasmopsis synoviae]AKJ21070.1 Deoxyadenosine kinase / Deoxyguanosine kinase [Mycoplasmopsis synoviae]AQU48407.1 Deoxyadenosine kinase / Deoxyguanosine kinase [Mycoplasmopsis synoviae]AWL83975.1 deoxyguanosine kinase [Mycoplasmopsis synoviae]QLE13704.1 deoxyguanosine kinase [Mycoplasmopsis synoviae]UZF64464.1 deoxynucleoside kinase [Mycoplasmopsis synoviae]
MIVAVSGMISSGKSTLVKKLNSHYEKNSLYLDEYKKDDEIFSTMLRWFLEKRENINLSFDLYVLNHHIESLKEIYEEFNEKFTKDDYLFLDRFPAEHAIFNKMDLVTNLNHKLAYDKALDNLLVNQIKPDLVLYLDIDFKTFQNRLTQRLRPEEVDNFENNIDYWKNLHMFYKQYFLELCKKYQIKYQIIDTNNLDEGQVLTKAISLIETFKNTKWK